MHRELLQCNTKGAYINQKGENTMELIVRSPGSQLEAVVFECPGLTWNQVFCQLDRLSREGQST